ncbi:cyclophilin-RNA interacting protein, partial [Reticulomyxa filosa]
VEGLRNWIGTYQQWKSWQQRSLAMNEKQSPLESIVQLIETGLDPNHLIATARAQQLRGLHRQVGLKFLALLLRESISETCRLQFVGVVSESLRNSGRPFHYPLVSKHRPANLFDSLGCCDLRIQRSIQQQLGECIDVLVSLALNDLKEEVPYLTRILALSDVFSLSFHGDLHEIIKEQKLLSAIFQSIHDEDNVFAKLLCLPPSTAPTFAAGDVVQLKAALSNRNTVSKSSNASASQPAQDAATIFGSVQSENTTQKKDKHKKKKHKNKDKSKSKSKREHKKKEKTETKESEPTTSENKDVLVIADEPIAVVEKDKTEQPLEVVDTTKEKKHKKKEKRKHKKDKVKEPAKEEEKPKERTINEENRKILEAFHRFANHFVFDTL